MHITLLKLSTNTKASKTEINIITLTSGTLKVVDTVSLSGNSTASETLIRITNTGNDRLYSPGLY